MPAWDVYVQRPSTGRQEWSDVELRTKHVRGVRRKIHAGVMFIEGVKCDGVDIERWDQQDIVLVESERIVRTHLEEQREQLRRQCGRSVDLQRQEQGVTGTSYSGIAS